MSIFKRGRTYWFHFCFGGRHIQRSTKQGNPRVARQIEAACRTELAKRGCGILERKPAPPFCEFAVRFLETIAVQCASKPGTVQFYRDKTSALLKYDLLANARLDTIDEALIAKFVSWRMKQVGIIAVNRALATLRRALRLAQEWRVIDRVPRFRLLPGERVRDFVLSRPQERAYLAACPDPLCSVAGLLIQTGMRLGEVFALRWEDVHLDPVGESTRGYIHVRDGKSRHAKRSISLTEDARQLLLAQKGKSRCDLVFVRVDGVTPLSRSTLDHQHERVRRLLNLSHDFVLHSFRHTMLTRMGEAGADAITIMKIAGHSTVTISQRYVHPTPETLERAFDRLEALDKVAASRAKQRPAATNSATLAQAGLTAVQ